VLKTQGRHGEVAAELHSDIPERFHAGMRLWALAGEQRREVRVEDLWPHKGNLVLKLAAVDSISQAEALVGCELQVPRGERAQLQPGWSYVSDLVGCLVFDGASEIGRVKAVRFGAGEAPLLVVEAGSKDYEIPFAEAYLKGSDLQRKRIHMQLPQGLLEVNEPPTEEEKREQQRRRR
jgi:16S rRNA processing protein RimM